MSHLTAQQSELVAIGASIACNCIPCVKFHVQKGRQVGLSEEVIREAVEIADTVRQVPARRVLEAAAAALGRERPGASEPRGKPCCGGAAGAPELKGAAGSPC